MKMQRILVTALILLYALPSVAPVKAQPTRSDYIKSIGSLIFYLSMEYGWRDNITPKNPRITEPNNTDKYFRRKLRWKRDNLEQAGNLADIMLKPVFIGSGLVTPIFSKSGYMTMFLTHLQVISISGVLANTVKGIVGRQRPSSYYETLDPEPDDNLSFFSGHTSFTFAIGSATAYMLTESHPKYKTLIWGTAISMATFTGYLRIAGDRHYMSDVVWGAAVGLFVGYWVPRYGTSPFVPKISATSSNRANMVRLSWNL
jgi:hypothetical protein